MYSLAPDLGVSSNYHSREHVHMVRLQVAPLLPWLSPHGDILWKALEGVQSGEANSSAPAGVAEPFWSWVWHGHGTWATEEVQELIHADSLDLLVGKEDPEAEKGCKDDLVALEETSHGPPEGLEGDGVDEGVLTNDWVG